MFTAVATRPPERSMRTARLYVVAAISAVKESDGLRDGAGG